MSTYLQPGTLTPVLLELIQLPEGEPTGAEKRSIALLSHQIEGRNFLPLFVTPTKALVTIPLTRRNSRQTMSHVCPNRINYEAIRLAQTQEWWVGPKTALCLSVPEQGLLSLLNTWIIACDGLAEPLPFIPA